MCLIKLNDQNSANAAADLKAVERPIRIGHRSLSMSLGNFYLKSPPISNRTNVQVDEMLPIY